MTIEGSAMPWPVVFVLVLLVLAGACAMLWLAAAGLRQAWEWWRDRPRISWVRDWWYDWRRDRVTPLLEDNTCPECGGTGVHEWDCPVDPALDPLPPERSREELGFTTALERVGLPPDHDWDPGCRVRGCPVHGNWQEARERRPPKWEAEARGHYMSMGLEFPSGLMARVRELTP